MGKKKFFFFSGLYGKNDVFPKFNERDKTIYSLLQEIIESPRHCIKVLDFIGFQTNEILVPHFLGKLEEAISAYKRKNRENLPLIFTNLRENIAKEIQQSYNFDSFLYKNQCIIPVFDEYGALSRILGLTCTMPEDAKTISKKAINFTQCNISPKVLNDNVWFFNNDKTTTFSIDELINDFNVYIIKEKLGALRIGHFEISDYHVLEAINTSDLFERKVFNAWCSRIIYSKFRGNKIDLIVYDSERPIDLVYEVKRQFQINNSYIEDLLIDTYKSPYQKPENLSLKSLNNKKVLLITDIVNKGRSISIVQKTIKQNNGFVEGIVAVVNNSRFKKNFGAFFYSLAELSIENYKLDETSADKICPECLKKNNILYFRSSKTGNWLDIFSEDDQLDPPFIIKENELFWKMVKETRSILPHVIDKNNGQHYYYYIDSKKLLKKYAEDINWDISPLFRESDWPDAIIFFRDLLSSSIVNYLVNKNPKLQNAIYLPIKQGEYDYDFIYFEKLKINNFLLVINTDHSGDIFEELSNVAGQICESEGTDYKISVFKLIDRSPRRYNENRELSSGAPIGTIFRVPLPSFTIEKDDCPICREMRLLEKNYHQFSYTAKRYVQQRIEILEPVEIDLERETVEYIPEKFDLEEVILKGKAINCFCDRSRFENHLMNNFIRGKQFEELAHILEAIPPEYAGISHIRRWLSDNIDKTNDTEHLKSLLRAALHSDPSLITPHLEKISKIFLTPQSIGFLIYLFEYLICEGVVSKEKFVKPLLDRIGDGLDRNSAPYRELINSIFYTYPEEIVDHPGLENIYNEIIKKVTKTDASVLITGETGTGKERIAKLIHDNSDRRDKPFIAVDTSSVPETLIESELFGHEKGAFTGATTRREGRLKQADGGTLFLDEISNISLNIQAKLLRTLQDDSKYKYKQFQRLGGEKEFVKSDFRLICASNIPIKELVKKGIFRKDLYYRINVIPIRLPSLRETPKDIQILTKRFLGEFCERYKTKLIKYDKTIDKMLLSSSWDGNVRELRNIIERLVVLSDEGKPNYDLIMKMGSEEKTLSMERVPTNKEEFITLLESTGWNRVKAAKKSGRSRTWLYNKMKQYNITEQRQL